MEELIRKIPIYHIFNIFLPGILFVFVLEGGTSFSLMPYGVNIYVYLLFSYFIGYFINGFSNVVISPFLKWTKFIKYAPYEDYLDASTKDQDIPSMYQTSNMFRTYGTAFFVLLVLKVYEWLSGNTAEDPQIGVAFFVLAMQCMFFFLHRRHTKLIVERINTQAYVNN